VDDYGVSDDGLINNADSDVIAADFKTSGDGIKTYYYHFDGLGSVVGLSDETGVLACQAILS
jgi:hypothetical protein